MNKPTKNELSINMSQFFDMYFRNEEIFEKFFSHLRKMFMARKALYLIATGQATYSIVEYGKEYFQEKQLKEFNKAIKELCYLSSLSKMLDRQKNGSSSKSFINGFIDTRNFKQCIELLEDIREMMIDEANIDIMSKDFYVA